MAGMKKVLDEEGCLLTMREASDIFELSPQAVTKMFALGYETIASMKKYRKKIKKKRPGGRAPKIHNTSRGKMTMDQMVKAHEHNLSHSTINYRGQKWGFDHKCIWLKKLYGKAFNNAAIALDGPPRGNDSDSDQQGIAQPSPDQKINRTKCCTRGEGLTFKRCSVYSDRLKMLDGIPEKCEKASGSNCPNFTLEE